MSAVLMLARSSLRRRWRSAVVLMLLVAFAGAVTLSLVAGARRTSTSLTRFEQWSRAADIEVTAGQASPEALAEFERSPGVAAVARLHNVALLLDGVDFIPIASQVDGSFSRTVDRPRVLSGRLADPRRPHELAVSESLARPLGLHVGDDLRFASYTPADVADLTIGKAATPNGPKVTFHVVGITRRPLDLGGRGAVGGVLVPTPAFTKEAEGRIGSYAGEILRVRTEHGTADVARVTRAARRVFGQDPTFAILSLGFEGAAASDAISVTTTALWIAAAVAAVAAIVAVGMALAREIALGETDQPTLAALGLRPRHRALAAAAIGVPVAAVGSVLAAVAAWMASARFPIGVARLAEPSPGMHVDGIVVVGGGVVVACVVLALAFLAGVRAVRAPRREPVTAQVGWTTRAVARLRSRPPIAIGVRHAIERGDDGLPSRSALVGASMAVAVVVAVLVFAAGIDRLATTPARFGWTWDYTAYDAEARAAAPDDCGRVSTRLTTVEGVDAVASICASSVNVAGRPVNAWSFVPVEGHLGPVVVDGRVPRTADEVMLGADTLAISGAGIGGTVRIAGEERSHTYRVVGTTVLPRVSDDAQPLAEVVVLTVPGMRALGKPTGGWNTIVHLAPDADRAAVRRRLRTLSSQQNFLRVPEVPAEIARVREIDALPVALAGFVAVVGLVAVGFALVTGVRRRRREFAVLKTLGFRRGQVRATVAWQATTVAAVGLLVGVPVGLVVGRLVWQALAGDLGVAGDMAWPLGAILVAGVVVIATVNLVAAVPARRAAATRPAVVLRSE